ILRELTEAGVSLAADDEPALGALAASGARKTGTRAKADQKSTVSRRKKTTTAGQAADVPTSAVSHPGEDAEWETADDAAVDPDADSETLDLDDESSVMGDSVHTYLKSIGRRTLLTAAEEVELAKRIEAGLYAEYKLENEPGLSDELREELEWLVKDG